MKAVVDRIVQYANRYQLTDIETGEVLGTFDFEEVTGTVQQVGTEIGKELFDSIADDLAARVKLSGGELAGTVVTFSDISDTAANVASGDTSATLWGKVKNWFSRLKALAFKNKVAAGDFEAGAIKNADVAADAAIAQSKVSGLMTDYVASISVSGRTVTYKNKNGVNMGSITTQDTTYELASQSSNGLMSSTDKTKLNGIESGAQKNTVLGVKGSSESAYRTGNVNITKANIGLGNVDNTSDEDKPVSTATQTVLNGKANTSGTYPNLTVGKATNADNTTKATQDASGNVITSTYATKNELNSGLSGKANTSGSYPNLTVGNAEKLGNRAASEYALSTDIPDVSNFAEKTGTYSGMSVGNATNATNLIPDSNGAVNPGGRGTGEIGENSVAIGKGSAAVLRAVALGANSSAKENNSIAIGYGSSSESGGSVSLGSNSSASGGGGLALGDDASATGTNSVSLGSDTLSAGLQSVALGASAIAEGTLSTALGSAAVTSETDSYVIQLGFSNLSALRCKVNLTVTSDERDKADINNITNALPFIDKLNPVTFVSNDRTNYISEENKQSEKFRKYGMCDYDRVSHALGTKKGERRRCGLLAQEVVAAMQEVYGTDNYANIVNDNFHDLQEKPSDVENKYTLAYANLVPFLIGAIKELNAKIKILEDKLQ